MSRAKPVFLPTPRIWTRRQVACRLNKSEGWMRDHGQELERHGFPRFDAFLGGWDADAIEAWLDRRSGLGKTAENDTDAWLNVVNGSN